MSWVSAVVACAYTSNNILQAFVFVYLLTLHIINTCSLREEKGTYPDSRNFIHTTFDLCLQVGRDLYTVERSQARINKTCVFISWSVVHQCT